MAQILRKEAKSFYYAHKAFTHSWSASKIRSTFIDHFVEKHGHTFVKSSGVIPEKGSGLFFSNAGMNQFREIFLGTCPVYSPLSSLKRAANSQKCIRTGGKHNDLDDVGHDFTHHTFFEMLGNWSFGDYFKEKAISMSWELLTESYCLPKERLYVTYFGGDEKLELVPDLETRDLWLQTGVPADHVLPGSVRDNFWEMGDVGPCGTCTEIHYDMSANTLNKCHLVNTDHPLVVEIWNLVFIQYNRLSADNLIPLKQTHVDTGMGLERISAVLQNKTSNYDTDLFLPIFYQIEKETGCGSYTGSMTHPPDILYRIIADHTRMISIALADGVFPASTGLDGLCPKLRQVMHRTFLNLRKLNAPPYVTLSLIQVVIETLGDHFPELHRNQNKILETCRTEEELYIEQMSRAYSSVSSLLRDKPQPKQDDWPNIKKERDMNFLLPEVLADVAKDLGVTDVQPILELSNIEEIATEAPASKLITVNLANSIQQLNPPSTSDFYKYQYVRKSPKQYDWSGCDATVQAVFIDDVSVDTASAPSSCILITDQTCFYSEAGGQAADTGTINSSQGETVLEIYNVQKHAGKVLHFCNLVKGDVQIGSNLHLNIDQERRQKLAMNHTATHLLNYTLKCLYGSDVVQASSSVTHDELSFSFKHQGMLTDDDLTRISAHVNTLIASESPLYTHEITYTECEAMEGVIKLPGVSYPNTVRVVTTDKELLENKRTRLPTELCGGTHIQNTGDIGQFVITRATGLNLPLKRIIASTGAQSLQAHEEIMELSHLAHSLIKDVKNGVDKENWESRLKHINKVIGSKAESLPKVERKEITDLLEQSRVIEKISAATKKFNLEQNIQRLKSSLQSCSSDILISHLKYKNFKEGIKIITQISLDDRCICLTNHSLNNKTQNAVVYAPETNQMSDQLLERLASHSGKPPQKIKSEHKLYQFNISADCNINNVLSELHRTQITNKS